MKTYLTYLYTTRERSRKPKIIHMHMKIILKSNDSHGTCQRENNITRNVEPDVIVRKEPPPPPIFWRSKDYS